MIFAHPHVTGNRGRERSGREEKFHLKKTKIKLCWVKTCWEEKRRWPTRVQLQPTSWVAPPHNMVSPDQPMCECVRLCVIFRDMGPGPWRTHCQYGGDHSWAAALLLLSREKQGNRPAKSHVIRRARRREKMEVADCGNGSLQELSCRGLMSSSEGAPAMLGCLWGDL